MWDFIKDVGRAIWDGITGVGNSLWNGFKWLIHRLIGLLELLGSLFGFMPRKKLRVKVVILLDKNKKPLASREVVDDVVARATKTFKDEANVRIISPGGSDRLIVSIYPEPAPDFVMKPLCEGGGFGQVFTRVGRWFRTRSAPTPAGSFLGYGAPATIFVVEDVQGKSGCFLPLVTNYGFIDSGALSGSDGSLLTLAHELGHACDLWHRSNGTLMEAGPGPRSARLRRYQRAVLRSSPRVTYF